MRTPPVVSRADWDAARATLLEKEKAHTRAGDALAAERRTAPGEDLVSHLVTVRDSDGGRLSEDELVTTCILLLNAGHEATVNVSGNGLLAAVALGRVAGLAALRG